LADKRYKWEAAQSLQKARRAKAERDLADAKRELAAARTEHASAEQRLREHLDAAPAELQAGARQDSALELQRAAAFALRHARTKQELRAGCARARAQVAQLETAARNAEQALAQAHEAQRAIEHDRERWQAEQRRELEQLEQLEQQESATRARDPR
jgi:hypothetical protein